MYQSIEGYRLQRVLDCLHGRISNQHLYDLSYEYLQHDFWDLLHFGAGGYDPDTLIRSISENKRRLKRRYRIHRFLRRSNGSIQEIIERYITNYELYRDALSYYRYASLRDKGVIRSSADIKIFKRKLQMMALSFRIRSSASSDEDFFTIDTFTHIFRKVTGCNGKEAEMLRDGIITFIDFCPKRYLERGLFAKYLGSLMGVYRYGYESHGLDLHQIIEIGGCFGVEYLFDEIIDDPGYSGIEKERYYSRIMQILESRRGELFVFSDDLLMAFTEQALVRLRDMLPPMRWTMVSMAFSVLAISSLKGGQWSLQDTLSDEDLYVQAALKGAYTRIIAAVLGGMDITGVFLRHVFRSGYLYQLPDDLRDIFDDRENGNVTPFNYYYLGANRIQYHPLIILLIAVSRISSVDYPGMKDATDLYMSCIYQSLKKLYLKEGTGDLCALFEDIHIPDLPITRHLCCTGHYYSMTRDFETEIAAKCRDFSLEMKDTISDLT